MSDQSITCRDCGQPFVFTAGEAEFYASRNYSVPQRCPDCRAARKAQNGGVGGGASFGGSRDRGGYSSGPREMHAAVCSACGKETEVPFVPTSGKPVYCRECFQDRRSSSYRSY